MNNWPINVAKFNAGGALEISAQLLRKMREGLGLLKLHEEPAIVFFVLRLPDSVLHYGGEKNTCYDDGGDNRSSRADSTNFG